MVQALNHTEPSREIPSESVLEQCLKPAAAAVMFCQNRSEDSIATISSQHAANFSPLTFGALLSPAR